MNWLRKWWYKRQREVDLQILWPACVLNAPSLYDAKAAFAAHAYNDPAWISLGEDEIYQRIEALR